MIVETEAYRGPDDRACHAYNNRRTPSTEVMYATGGVAYIYICYGMHHLMNVVTGPKDNAHAVLIRALEPAEGIDIMAARRRMDKADVRLTKGPGALSLAMGLQAIGVGSSYCQIVPLYGLKIVASILAPNEICSGPRIGVESAGEAALWPWRYFIKGNKYVSAKKTCG